MSTMGTVATWVIEPTAVITPATQPLYTVDDAHDAAAILREADAGHDEAATRLADASRIGDLSNVELAMLCRVFGVEV